METSARTVRLAKENGRLGKSILRAFFCTLLLFGALTLLSSFFIFRSEDPSRVLPFGGYAVLGFCAFFFGFLSAKFYRRNPLLSGALAGAVLLVFLLLLSFFAEGAGLSVGLSVALHAGVFLLTLFGSLLGGTGRKKTSRRRAS